MGLFRSAGVVSGATFVSRILGMVRDILFASLLGAGAALDAFVVAWRVPNLFRRLLGEGALSSAFIPVFSGVREEAGRAGALRFFSTVLTLLTLVLALITVVGVALALLLPPSLFGVGAAAAKAELTLSLLALLFPYVLLINVMALFMAILNSLDHFFAPAIAPAVLNCFWIGGVLLAPRLSPDPEVQVRVVAVAILAGGVVQLGLQLPFLRSRGVPLRPRLGTGDPALRRMLLMMGPMVLGLAPVQVNILLDTVIAEACIAGNGANSRLFFGNRLMQLPLALIGIAMAVAVFPVFSRLAKSGRDRELGRTLSEALRTTFFLAAPAAAGLLALAGPLTALIYEWGRFGQADSAGTAGVLAMYAVGVPLFSGLQILTRLYYAKEDVRTPVRVGVLMVLANLGLNLLLVGPMAEAGLALATSLVAGLNLLVLGVLARRRLGVRGLRGVLRSFAASLLLAAVMGAVVWLSAGWLRDGFPDRARLLHKLLWVLPPALAGAAAYLGGAALLRRPEAIVLARALRGRTRAREDASPR